MDSTRNKAFVISSSTNIGSEVDIINSFMSTVEGNQV